MSQRPTEDDEWQLQPDDGQPVEQEGTHKAADVAHRGANRHSQVSVAKH